MDPACCSDPNDFIPLGEGRIKTSLGKAPHFNYPSGQGTASHTTQNITESITSPSTVATTSHAAKSIARPVTSSIMTATLDTSTQRTMAPTRIAHTTPAAVVPSHTKSSNKNNINVKVGTGAGVSLGIAAFAALGYIIYLRHGKPRGKASEPTGATGVEEENDYSIRRVSQASTNNYQTVGYQPSELPAQREPIELFDTERHQLQDNRHG